MTYIFFTNYIFVIAMTYCAIFENSPQKKIVIENDNCFSAGLPVAVGDTISIQNLNIVQVCARSSRGPVFYTLTTESGERALGTNP